ncbi:MAG: cytidine deaminase [Elusimicrobia bacterium]|nr:cytidine deaminase [Elusimicrobiota bacterium]
MKLHPRRIRTLIEAAKRAQKLAYCPYSRYPVGAAVLTGSGRIFAGANVENASYGLSMCAERVAVSTAVTHGQKDIRAACVVGRKARPCGACRQVLLEFSSKDTDLYIVDIEAGSRREKVTPTRVYSLLPGAFDPLGAGLLALNPQNLVRLQRTRRAKTSRRKR